MARDPYGVVQVSLGETQEVMLLIIGFIGLISWAGLIIGPIFALVGSVMPGKRH